MNVLDAEELLSERVVLKHNHGYEIVGTLVGIVTEPSFIVVGDDGRKHVYGQTVVAAVEAA